MAFGPEPDASVQALVVAGLTDLGIDTATARQVAQVARNEVEALLLLGREADGTPSPGAVREFFSEEASRLYYVVEEAGQERYNGWDAPPRFAYAEWALDAELYRLPLPLARDLYCALDWLLNGATPHDGAQRAVGVLATVVGNVADCGNAEPKYRTIKTSNRKFVAAVWEVPAAAAVLYQVGFQLRGEAVTLPEGTNMDLITAAAARLRRLAARKGHSGSAELYTGRSDGGDPGAGSSSAGGGGAAGRPPSRLYGAPGFRWQERIYHCSACDRAINDGSERLFSRRHDAPAGEYRFECQTCVEAGRAANLCESCWDEFQAAAAAPGAAAGRAPVHDPSHSFHHIGPRLTRHNDYYGTGGGGGGGDGANPWGRPPGGGLGRAYTRLQERYGLSFI